MLSVKDHPLMRVNNTPLFFKSHYFIYKIQTHIRVEEYLRGKRLLSHTPGLFGKLEGRKPFSPKYISRCILYAARTPHSRDVSHISRQYVRSDKILYVRFDEKAKQLLYYEIIIIF